MNCDEARPFIVRDADGTVDGPTGEARDRAVRLHLAACSACRDVRDAQRAVRVALAARPNRGTPPDFAARVMAKLEPTGSWLDAVDWRAWTLRLAPVATALFLVAAVGLRTSGPPDAPQPIEFVDLVTAWGDDAPTDARPAFMLLSGVDVAADALLDVVLTADPDDPLETVP